MVLFWLLNGSDLALGCLTSVSPYTWSFYDCSALPVLPPALPLLSFTDLDLVYRVISHVLPYPDPLRTSPVTPALTEVFTYNASRHLIWFCSIRAFPVQSVPFPGPGQDHLNPFFLIHLFQKSRLMVGSRLGYYSPLFESNQLNCF